MEYFVTQLINGLAAGSLYALIAVGYNMVYGILQLVNFTHGDVYMFGTFIAMTLLGAKVPFPLAVLIACTAGGLLSLTIEKFAYRPVRNAGSRIVPMISAIGATLIIKNVAQLIWGASARSFPQYLPAKPLKVGSFTINSLHLIIFSISILLMISFVILTEKTKIGKAMRCVSQDIPAARLVGIRANRVIQLVYFIGAFMGVIGGILFAMYYNVVWIGMGMTGTLRAWTSAIIGGMGNIYGGFFGGLLLGVGESLISGYISSSWRDGVSYVILMLVLLLKPHGLLGKNLAERA